MITKLTEKISNYFTGITEEQDKLWLFIFAGGLFLLFIWDLFFLNSPAFNLLIISTINTFLIGLFTVAVSFLAAWGIVLLKHFFMMRSLNAAAYALDLALDFLESIPQVIWVLISYFFAIIVADLSGVWLILFLVIIISFAFLNEVIEEMENRINHFKKSDFYNAMLVLGIAENKIINREILWSNSLAYLINKGVNVFASTIFLLCSVDFIVSVGLTSNIALSNLPGTLGSLLGNLDSKQDILAIGNVFSNPLYISEIFTKHLQGVSTAFVLIFTLIAAYKISNGLIKRKKLN